MANPIVLPPGRLQHVNPIPCPTVNIITHVAPDSPVLDQLEDALVTGEGRVMQFPLSDTKPPYDYIETDITIISYDYNPGNMRLQLHVKVEGSVKIMDGLDG